MFSFQPKKEFRHRKVKRGNIEIEPQEIFLDAISQKKELEFGLSEQRFEVPLSKKVFQGIFIAFLALMLFLFALTFRLQVIEGKRYSSLAKEESQKIYIIKPTRGVIYDRNFRQLVWNKPSFCLIANIKNIPKDQRDYEKIIGEVSMIIGQSPEEIDKKIKNADGPQVLISCNISHKALILLETKANSGCFPGFQIKENVIRDYSQIQSLSHLIGYTGKINQKELVRSGNYSYSDYVGRTGIEKLYEETLRGKPGQLLVKVDAVGKEREKDILSQPKTGKSLVLWLDSGLQQKIEEELKKELGVLGCKKAAAIALDPKTGGVLSSVSVPSFDSNLFSRGIKEADYKKIIDNQQKPLLDRVISGLYPTGSSIKPFIASAALQEHVITEKTKLYCPLKLCLENTYSHSQECFLDWKYHGWTSVEKAIAESVNPFFYIIGGGYVRPKFADKRLPEQFKGLGVRRINNYLSQFGFGKKTGIGLPGEKNGRIPNPLWKKEYFRERKDNIWYRGDTYNLSIGQGYFLATPLQLATAFQVIANKGILYQPQLVKEIVNDKREIIRKSVSKVLGKNFINKSNLEIVREGMRQAVTSPSGSSHILSDLPFVAAAKTGTAQIPGKDLFDNWVTVFAPYNNPQIVLTIVIEDVKGMRPAALPVAKEALKWYFAHKERRK